MIITVSQVFAMETLTKHLVSVTIAFHEFFVLLNKEYWSLYQINYE